jgi:hypothetical protein
MAKYLTIEQTRKILDGRPQGVSPEEILSGLQSRGYTIQGLNEEPKETKTGLEKVAGFVGGEKIGQGLGQALNQSFAQKQIEETQKGQMDLQKQFVERIRQKKELGEDTSRLEAALGDLGVQMRATGEGAEAQLNPYELTKKQVIGDALQLGTTVLGAGQLPGAAKGIVSSPTIARGIAQGAKTGAITGGIYGATSGAAEALKKDASAGDVAYEAGVGGLIGGVSGAAIGGLTGGISGAINKPKVPKQDKVFEYISPRPEELSPTEYMELVNKGKITPKTSTKAAQYVLSDQEKAIALKYKPLLNRDPVKSTVNIVNEIANKDAEVEKFLTKNNTMFNREKLRSTILNGLGEVEDVTIPTERLNDAKQKLVDSFIESIKTNDTKSLWKARKSFDAKIERAFSGSPTTQNQMKRGFRNIVQDYIADITPDDVYSTKMKDMRELFSLRDIMNAKARSEKGKSAIAMWARQNPLKAKVVGGIGATALGGIGYGIIAD